MKKIKILSTIFLSCLLLTTGCGCKKKTIKAPELDIPENGQDIQNVVENKTEQVQGDYTVTNLGITAKGAMNYVNGTVTNNGKNTETIKVTLYLKNENDLILGKVDTIVESIAPAEVRNFEIGIMGDYRTVNKYQVIIEKQ